jgi:hypothetical protein
MTTTNFPPAKIEPLSSLTRLTPEIHHHIPSPQTRDSRVQTAPKLILLLGWMEARDLHLAKYVSKYQSLYPTSQILLIKCPLRSMVLRARGAESVQPAVAIIQAAVVGGNDREKSNKPDLLIHLFSNGGSSLLSHLYTAFTTPSLVPSHTTIFDSAPGEWSYAMASRATLAGIPAGWVRLLSMPVVHLLCVAYWLLYIPWGRAHPFALERASHNDLAKVRERRRVYVYSERDELVTADMVERHAADAVRKGFEVRLERFRGSAHCAHMLKDPERYWGVVRDTWEGGRK